MRVLLLLLLWAGIPGLLPGQGVGGGVYLEDGASCVGCVVWGNQALNGYGVGGGNGTLLNGTIVNNTKLQVDMTSVQLGYIYCADGAIVDTTEYQDTGREDAVGVVYWLRRDADDPWPAGAVVALEEITGPWGLTDRIIIDWQKNDPLFNDGFHLRDTACYQTTKRMWQADYSPAVYDPVTSRYDAGTFCYLFKAQQQLDTRPMSWALPTYLYLRRLFAAFPTIDRTLAFLQKEQPGLTINYLNSGKSLKEVAWYWSCEDMGNYSERAYSVNFISGETGSAPATFGKQQSHSIRPVLIY